MPPISADAAVFVTGHRGLVGSALVRRLEAGGHAKILTATRQELDLRRQKAVDDWFAKNRPDYVIHAAGTVGGILANSTRPADFLYDNLLIHATVMHAAREFEVGKLLYLGSSCIYPRNCKQPIQEASILTGPLEPTNEAYAIAKIAGVLATRAYRKQYACNFISAMPTNLYGPGDRFDLGDSHVLPALLRKFHEAKLQQQREVVVWGSGRPKREFLYVDDLADACVFLLEHYDEAEPINVGSGEDLSIAELADRIRQIVYPVAKIVYDSDKPDGTPRKLLDVSRLRALGWKHRIGLGEGIEKTYQWFCGRGESERE